MWFHLKIVDKVIESLRPRRIGSLDDNAVYALISQLINQIDNLKQITSKRILNVSDVKTITLLNNVHDEIFTGFIAYDENGKVILGQSNLWWTGELSGLPHTVSNTGNITLDTYLNNRTVTRMVEDENLRDKKTATQTKATRR